MKCEFCAVLARSVGGALSGLVAERTGCQLVQGLGSASPARSLDVFRFFCLEGPGVGGSGAGRAPKCG